MSLGCLRLALCHAVRALHQPVCSSSPASLLLPPCRPLGGYLSAYLGVALQQWSRFCTEAGGPEGGVAIKPQKKKHNPNARVTIGSVGRRIFQPRVQLLGEEGEELGVVQRQEVLKMMDDSGLKLVVVNERSNPPVYRLMTGKQIHEEQVKLKEKQKFKTTGSVQVKELTLYSGIASHDLENKLKQAASWLEKKHHIKLTLRAKHGSSSETALNTVLDQMVEKISVPVGFVSTSRLISEGRAATCILRPPSAKELAKAAKQRTQNPTEPPRPEPPRPEPGITESTASTSVPGPPKDSEQQ
ncbi:translation initiation factor IF-3, mitochondrial [Astyanax mexicanus]|uniref:translation initiation factor IF-3, mitochondrial n=1 Tax=Astyanax mexicanus TaxID=7994 RepID=UPI0020CAB7C7|nr:translation initiation factor IF-3, mitochondrial [Astyanax mexicanus]XP_049321519.1 translation initiation factor IF-3, mitochondrial [Astyanax mexicanus]